MSNIFTAKNTTFFLAIISLVTSPIPGEEIATVDFDPFGSNEVNELATPQIVIDQSPVIPQIEFTNNDISMAFQIISDATGWSIFSTAEVSRAKISLWAKTISAKELLETVVTLAGFTYHRETDIIAVMTYDEYIQFYGLAKEVVSPKYARAESIATVITPFLSKLGKSVVHTQTNTIVLFESEANLETIIGIIKRLDIPTESEKVLEVLTLQYMDAEILAETLQQVFSDDEIKDDPKNMQKGKESTDHSSERITKPDAPKEIALSTPQSRVEVFSIGRTNQLIVKAFRSDIEEIMEFVERLDIYVEPITKSYHFVYVNAAEIYNGLERILNIPSRSRSGSGTYSQSNGRGSRENDRPGGITLVEKTNSILLTGPPSVHRIMTNIVENVDVATTYETGIIRIYKLENADIDEVAEVIKELTKREEKQQEKPGEPKFTKESSEDSQQTADSLDLQETEEFIPQVEAKVAVSKATNSIVIQATARQHRELEKVIEELDRRRKQVFIKAMIIEVTTNDDLDLGVELDRVGEGFLAFTSFGLSSINPATGARNIIVSPGGTAAVLQPNKVQAIVKALQANDNVRIESTPQILVNDNAVGAIQSIAEEPTRQTNQGETTTTTSFGEYVTAGTQFAITPHISENNNLRVEYQITINSFGEQADPELPPTRSTSNIQSEATIPDGFTIVVGGIQTSNESESVDKVPLLGDIPLVGLIFRNTIIRKQYITTYLFITTTIIKNENFDDLKEVSNKALEDVKEDESSQTLDAEIKDVK
jgi:type II secretory pathway component GspD/PulD (secretin)